MPYCCHSAEVAFIAISSAVNLAISSSLSSSFRISPEFISAQSTIYEYQNDEIQAIEKKLEELVDEQEVQLGDITLLSMNEFENSVASKLDRRWRRKLFIIDNSFGNQWHRTSLTFSTIRNFKGLENRYIMLIDLDNFNGSRDDISQLYVGMTRANAFLWMATPKKIKHVIDKIVATNSSHVVAYLQKLGEKAEND